MTKKQAETPGGNRRKRPKKPTFYVHIPGEGRKKRVLFHEKKWKKVRVPKRVKVSFYVSTKSRKAKNEPYPEHCLSNLRDDPEY